jgi:hypothetical protein
MKTKEQQQTKNKKHPQNPPPQTQHIKTSYKHLNETSKTNIKNKKLHRNKNST